MEEMEGMKEMEGMEGTKEAKIPLKEKIFITGATGFIGSHFLRALDLSRYEISVLVRKESHFDLPVQQIRGDLKNRDSYARALEAQSIVVHFAAEYRIGPVSSRKMYESNVLGTQLLMDTAFNAGVKKFIHISSTAALGETEGEEKDETQVHNGTFRSYYEETKHIAHGLVQRRVQQGKPAILAILGGVFGTGDRGVLYQTIRDYFRGKIPFQVESQSRFNLTHIDSICRGLVLILEKGKNGESYLLAEKNISMEEIFMKLARYKKRAPLKKIKPRTLKGPAWLFDQISRLSGLSFPLSQEALRILEGSTYTYHSQKAQKELGWESHSFEEDFLNYLQSQDFVE